MNFVRTENSLKCYIEFDRSTYQENTIGRNLISVTSSSCPPLTLNCHCSHPWLESIFRLLRPVVYFLYNRSRNWSQMQKYMRNTKSFRPYSHFREISAIGEIIKRLRFWSRWPLRCSSLSSCLLCVWISLEL